MTGAQYAKDPTGEAMLKQEALKQRGLYSGALDNDWGPKSQAALRQFQADFVIGTGTSRTDWRGFRAVAREKLERLLPLPVQPLVTAFLRHAAAQKLNPLFLLAISRHETGNWTSAVFREKNNAMGISNFKGAIALSTYDESIRWMAELLSRKGGAHAYYAKCRTLQDVANVYAPPGAGNDPGNQNIHWPRSVAKFWSELEESLAAA